MNPELSQASEAVNPAEPAPLNFINRITGVWFSPGETFADIGRAPRMLAPILALMIIGSATAFLMINRIGVRNFFAPGIEQGVAKGRMTQEAADKQLETMSTGTVAIVIKSLFTVVGLVQSLIIALILVGVAKLITMLIGGENTFKPLYAVSLYTLLGTSIVSSVILIIVLFLKQPEEIDINNLLGSNLAALLTIAVGKDGLPKFIMALARWVDVFAIWMLALLAIGYAAVTKRAKASSFGMALGAIYVVLALIGSAWAALMG